MSQVGNLKTTATVGCFVDIYPYEGESFSLQQGQVLRCDVTKNIKAPLGQFALELAPVTLADYQSWSQIITPMSLCVIGMQRGDKSAVVMIGIVKEINEPQIWQADQPTRRNVTVTGVDIAYFFSMVDYYSLWYLANIADAGPSILASGLLSGNPGTVGKKWYDEILAASTGVFSNTFVPYKDGQIKFAQIFGTQFDQYPVFVPYGEYFIGATGAWIDKFRDIFPFPIYEFFVTTAIEGNYKGLGSGNAFTAVGLPGDVSASAGVVARLNPLPKLVASANGDGSANFDSIDTTQWSDLPSFDLQGAGFIASDVKFSENEVLNFFNINPTWLNGMNGVSNNNVILGTLLFAYAFDQASVARYGYRPLQFDIPWFADPTGQAAQENSDQTKKTFARILGELAGYYEASPLMANATCTTWLRPDIQIGTKFSYNPFKNNEVWDFYVETVQHSFNFGGPTTTTLGLTRGLPHSVYNDSGAGGLLYNVHIGNAQRVNGEYKIGLPEGAPSTLKSLTPTQLSQLVQTLNQLYVKPQGLTTTNSSP